jgi:YegS/Rv2252/BmrU family lipid kinase
MMKKLLLLANIHSGKAEIASHIGDMIDYYNKENFIVTAFSSQAKGHIINIIEDMGGNFDNIVVCGGDGTLNEAVNAIMNISGHKPKLGYVPCGSANDFAANVGIPRDICDAYRVAVCNNPFSVDVGRINNRYFTYVTGFGLFTNLPYETPQSIKNIIGYNAYVLEGIKQLSTLQSWKMKVNYDDTELEDEYILGLVSNSNRIAGMHVPIKATLNDGVFEVLLVKKPKLLTAIPALISSLVDNNYDNDLIHTFRTSRVVFECEEKVKWTVDGEKAGAFNRAGIRVFDRAIDINVPLGDNNGLQ